MKKLLFFMFALLIYAGTLSAQVSAYSFASSSGTYTEITGGTLLGTATNDDQRFVDPAVPAGGTTTTGVGFPIGFNFTYGGIVYDRVAINSNGWISLGQSALTPSVNNASTSAYTPIGSTSTITPDDLVARIVALGKDLQGQTAAELRIETIGVSPNQTLVVQWKGYKKYTGGVADNFNFQIRLNETTNVVEIVYGTMTNNATSTTVQVGLRGAPSATATNYNNRTTTTDWSATTAGGSNAATCTLSSTIYPSSGRTFTFTPPVPCLAPTLQPTTLALTPLSTTCGGTFTTVAGSDSYLVIRSTDATLTNDPVDGTTYAVGATLGNGIIVAKPTTGTFNATGLTANTAYYFFVFSMNSLCSGGPLYLTASPLTGSASTCVLAPVSSAVSNVTLNSFDANWAASTGATAYILDVATTSVFTAGTFVSGFEALNVGNVLTYPVTGLNASSIYYYRVSAVGSSCTSAPSGNQTVTTLCAEVALFSENFDGVTTPAFPACWQKVGTAGSAYTQTTNPSSSPNCMYIYGSGVTPVVAMPPVNNAGAGTHQLRFKLRANFTVGESIEIGYLTDRNDAATFVPFTTATASTLTYVEKTVLLGTSPGTATTIAFRHPGTLGYSCLIDDVIWEQIPSCLAPTAVTSSAITTTTATISWTAAAPAPASGYEYEVRTSGAAGSGATGLTVSGSTVAGDVDDNLTGLTASTQYFVYVRSYCGGSDYSAWTSSYSFTTLCDPVTVFPWTEGFEGATFAPICWTNASWGQSTYGAAHTGLEWAYSNLSGSILTTPGFTLSSNCQLKYWYRVESATYPQDMDVLLSTDGVNFTTVLSNLVGVINTTYAEVVIDLSAYTGQTVYIRFNGLYGTGGADWGICVDDVAIELIPAGIWSGTVSSSWNNTGNWTSGTIPTLTDNVVISSGAPNMPIVDLAPATPAVCNNLTINVSATLQVAPGMALTANGNTTNDGTFTLKSDATGIGSFIDNGTIAGSGTYNVENYLTGSGGSTPNGRFWYVGSPVPSATSTVFTASGDNRLWSYSEGPVTQNYTEITTDGVALNTLSGYVARLGATETINFSGTTLNTGSLGSSSSLTRSTLGVFDGFNLVSNPYPSAVNWGTDNTQTPGLTKTNLESTIWYRSNGNFATYNSSADGTGVNGGQQRVPAMQAFWVRVASGNTTGGIQYANTTRVHSTQAFYKTKSVANIFRMTVSNGVNTDEVAVGFHNNALETFENYDSWKMFGDASFVPQAYTLTTDNTQTAINGFPILGSSEIRIVPLGISTDVAGTFTLNATNLTDFDASIPVSLEDLTTGTIQDLRQNASYSFTTGVVNNANRFRLHFGTMTTDITESENASTSVYAYGNTMYVNTPQINSVIDVYDMVGNKVLSQISKSGMNTIQAGLQSGMYLVKVQSNNGVVTTEKVMISK